MTIQKRNRRRRKLAEIAARLTRYTTPGASGESHTEYVIRFARACSVYSRWGVPALLVEIERSRRIARTVTT